MPAAESLPIIYSLACSCIEILYCILPWSPTRERVLCSLYEGSSARVEPTFVDGSREKRKNKYQTPRRTCRSPRGVMEGLVL